MNDDAKTRLAERMAQLRDSYRERMVSDCSELSRLAVGLDGTTNDPRVLQEMLKLLHGLAGSAGTFGFDGLGMLARELEVRIDRWLLDASLPDAAARQHLQAEVGALHADAQAAASTAARAPEPSPLPAPSTTPPVQANDASELWLVDPDATAATALSQQLQTFGYHVRALESLDAITRAPASASVPDVVLIDLSVLEAASASGLDASSVHRLIGAHTTLLCLADRGDFAARVTAARIGCVGYVLRPVDAPHLVSLIDNLLERQHPVPERVLLIEDEVELAEHYRLVLEAAGMTAEILVDETQVIEALAVHRPELVLMGLRMPSCSGPELATVIRQHEHWTGLPIVYLSTETDLGRQADALSRGGDDFLTKPIADAHLVAAVRVRVARARQLSELMTRDSLTGLLKHGSFKEAAEAEVARSLRIQRPLCVVMLDIDHFKQVNDSHGHSTGDVVIATLATVLRQRLRKSDIVGRYGGEEFAAVLVDCDADAAAVILDDLRQRFAAVRFKAGLDSFASTFSCGFACSEDFPDLDSTVMLEHADAALYDAKRSGRNRVCNAAAREKPAGQ